MVKEIVIQHLIMPSGIVDNDSQLYVNYDNTSFPVALQPGERLDFCTHFNFLPIGKLRKYTNIGETFLRLHHTGTLSVTVRIYSSGGGISENTFSNSGDNLLPLNCSEGTLLGISIESQDASILYSGEFLCKTESLNSVYLAHVICTYHREDELRSKLNLIDKFLKDNPDFEHNYKQIVIDNGNTIPEAIQSENYGGSGGFTRGILEACKDQEVTHILLNDDDALLDPEILFRTVSFYSLLKEEYADTQLGGTMLFKDKPCTSHESGAVFQNHKPHSLKHNLDLSLPEENVKLEHEEKIDYFGWWYLAFPKQNLNYSLPFFFKLDDVEYGLRSKSNKITLCGISVWHPSFTSNYSATGVYYANRNLLALLACHNKLTKEALNGFFERALLDTACLRYLSTEATIKAVEAFLKGPDHMFNLFRNGSVQIENYQIQPIDSLKSNLKPLKRKEASFGFRKFTFNGAFLPSSGDLETDFGNMQTKDFYKVGKVLYVKDQNNGILVKRSLSKAMTQTWKLHSLKKKVLKNLDKLNKEYSESLEHYSSKEFWKSVFDNRKD